MVLFTKNFRPNKLLSEIVRPLLPGEGISYRNAEIKRISYENLSINFYSSGQERFLLSNKSYDQDVTKVMSWLDKGIGIPKLNLEYATIECGATEFGSGNILLIIKEKGLVVGDTTK